MTSTNPYAAPAAAHAPIHDIEIHVLKRLRRCSRLMVLVAMLWAWVFFTDLRTEIFLYLVYEKSPAVIAEAGVNISLEMIFYTANVAKLMAAAYFLFRWRGGMACGMLACLVTVLQFGWACTHATFPLFVGHYIPDLLALVLAAYAMTAGGKLFGRERIRGADLRREIRRRMQQV